MSASDVIYVFRRIQSAARDYDPSLLLDFLVFPMHQQGRCPGDILETPDDFIRRFPMMMDAKTRSEILKYMPEDLIINSYGVGMTLWVADYSEAIWFGGYCNDSGCGNYRIVINLFLEFMLDPFVWSPEYTPEPTYDPGIFQFGTYQYLTAYNQDGKEWKTPDKILEPYAKARVTVTRTTYTDAGFGENTPKSCVYQALDFCPVDPTARVSAFDFGLTSVGELHVVCDIHHIYYFDLLENDRLGYYVDYNHYFVLGLID